MLSRRTGQLASLAGAAAGAAGALPQLRGYKYQEFEFSKSAQLIWYYPREAPNTSYIPDRQIGTWIFWGWSREEMWLDRDERRYQTTFQMIRKLIMCILPALYIFPYGIPKWWASEVYGEYGERSTFYSKKPMDDMYIEGALGQTLDAEWVRHIHATDSF
jgi:hypothetical protein